jgi:branched-subunit amino acid transport protein
MFHEWLLILGMAVVTFLCRYPVLALVSKVGLPARLVNALRFIPVAVLTAIIAPAMLMPNGRQVELTLYNSHLVAGLAAMLVAWRSRQLLPTIVVGMALFGLWRWLVG